MKIHPLSPARLLPALALLVLPMAHAGAPAGQITQLSGFVMAVKADGKLKALSAQSKVEVGDTLVSEKDSFVRLALDDGNEAVLGPATTLKIERFSKDGAALELVGGKLQVTGAATARPGSFTIEAGQTTIDARTASFFVDYVLPQQQPALALRLLYTRTSLALAPSGVMTDGGGDQPLRDALREVIAQSAPPPPGTGGQGPGLYVHVIDGLINLTNRGGSQSFAAGQFGYTANFSNPPVVVPANPGIQFTPPPTFSSTSTHNSSLGGSKAGAIDCEVR
jgi:hypothetical protein